MNPSISKISQEKELLNFTLSNIKVPFANALRRTILSDIDINVCITEKYEENQCDITKNTTRFHNEILKHRLSCIPIHMKELDVLPGNYILEVDAENDTDDIKFVTTEDFRIKNKNTNNYLTRAEVMKIYPPSKITNHYIDFVRLRPKISETIKGESIKFTCEYSIGNASVNSMYNVVSTCSYGNTVDIVKANEEWEKIEKNLSSDLSEKEISFEKKNYYALDAQRHCIENSFDFIIETLGIYDNKEIVIKGCEAMIKRLSNIIEKLDSDEIPINNAEMTVANAYSITFDNEDHTLGGVLQEVLYEKHYMEDKTINFVGFKKVHPHDTFSLLKLVFVMEVDNNYIRQIIRTALVESLEVFDKIKTLFK